MKKNLISLAGANTI